MDNDPGIKSLLSLKTLISVIAILIIFNLVYLDISEFRKANSEVQKEETSIVPSAITPYSAPSSSSSQTCPNSCLAQIYQATTSSKVTSPTITPTEIPTPTSVPPASSQTSSVSSVKEFFIPFGSGTNSSGDWEDVGGLKVSIDTANYSSIKSAVFEASVRIPTGNQTAYVRLFNETDKHPVWLSDVSLEGGTPQLLLSKPITLDSGNKIYKVQMKTSLKYQAVLDQARIRITIN